MKNDIYKFVCYLVGADLKLPSCFYCFTDLNKLIHRVTTFTDYPKLSASSTSEASHSLRTSSRRFDLVA